MTVVRIMSHTVSYLFSVVLHLLNEIKLVTFQEVLVLKLQFFVCSQIFSLILEVLIKETLNKRVFINFLLCFSRIGQQIWREPLKMCCVFLTESQLCVRSRFVWMETWTGRRSSWQTLRSRPPTRSRHLLLSTSHRVETGPANCDLESLNFTGDEAL